MAVTFAQVAVAEQGARLGEGGTFRNSAVYVQCIECCAIVSQLASHFARGRYWLNNLSSNPICAKRVTLIIYLPKLLMKAADLIMQILCT